MLSECKKLDYLKYSDEGLLNATKSAFKDTYKINTWKFSMISLGLIGNIFCIFVFLQKKMRTRKFNCYLLTLSIFKFIFCFILLMEDLIRFLEPNELNLQNLNEYLVIIIDCLIHTIDSYLAVIKLVVSIDHLYAIKYPLKIKTFITTLHSKSIIFSALFGIILIKITENALFRFYENFITVTIFHTIISPLIFNIIPAILSLILNSFLIKEVLNYYEVHKCITSEVQLSNRKNKQTKASIFTCGFSHNIVNWSEKSHYFVIAIVSLWLVLTEIPYFTFKSYFYFFCDSKFSKTADIKKIQFILTMFFISNHCINFFIYFFFYSMFRKSIFNVFCSKLCCVRFREPLNQERFLGKKTPVIKKDGN